MRPIEIIHSIQRISAAKEIQDQAKADPYKAGGELNIQQIEEKNQIEQTTVIESGKKESIDPDEKKEGGNEQSSRNNNQEKSEEEEENNDNNPKDPDKGNFIDINA